MESNITSGLPPDYVTHPFTTVTRLRKEAEKLLERLQQNEQVGNQYILVLNLPPRVLGQLAEERSTLPGINYRLMFDGTTALVKVIPSSPHENATSRFRDHVSIEAVLMGTSRDDILWGGRATYRPSVAANKGKEGDDCCIPPNRQPRAGQPQGWPSLVIETGVTESRDRLREDAKWWFRNSQGAVRTVILLDIKRVRKTISLEKWQLSPPGQPVTAQQALQTQRMAVPPMPPLTLQPAVSQHPFIAQTATITATSATGSPPIYLHYQAVFDRAPGPGQSDIRFNAADLIRVAVDFQ